MEKTFKELIEETPWQSVAEKLADALEEARMFTIWCEDIIETDDEKMGIYNNLERSVLENSYNALNDYKKLKDKN